METIGLKNSNRCPAPLGVVMILAQCLAGQTIRSSDPSRLLSQSAYSGYSKTAHGSEQTPIPADLQEAPLPAPDFNELEVSDASKGLERFVPWWSGLVPRPILGEEHSVAASPNELAISALERSPRIMAVQELPRIEAAEIEQAWAEFDARTFLESNFDDISDPVGDLLTTGGPDRLNDHFWSASGGFRRRTLSGSEWELAQDAGFRNSNSRFFVPNDQGTARLRLSLTQPLLRGKGPSYNSHPILLARLQTNAAWYEYQKQLQDHLLATTEGYWSMYYHRALLVQTRKSSQRAVGILETLKSRRSFDAMRSQVARAEAEVASRRKDVIRAVRDVRNSQVEILRLVGDPQLRYPSSIELLPSVPPTHGQVSVDIQQSLAASVGNRPEIQQTLQQVKTASVQHQVARHELLPRLDVVLSTYVSGLEGDSGVFRAWGDQFTDGVPSYSAGVVFEVPRGRRAEYARIRQSQARVRRLTSQFRATLDDVGAQIAVAVGEVLTAYDTLVATHLALKAAEIELESSHAQWERRAGDRQTGSVLLENLLDSQQRLAERERDFIRSEVDYMKAQARLHHAEGTLLTRELTENADMPAAAWPPDDGQ
jgi:outer membrane protein TolC